MKNIMLISCFIFFGMIFFYCKPSSKATNVSDGHTSRNSLDWQGVYTGILPCADCSGIETRLELNTSLDYTLKTKYTGKAGDVFQSSGKFNWNKEGNTIILNDSQSPGKADMYFVGENALTKLDMNGNKITGNLADNYVLHKLDNSIREKYWKLTELYGQPVVTDSAHTREAYIIFKQKDNRVIGSGGCNNFNGSYELKGENGINLSQLISTQMACANMEIETLFHKALQSADNYYINSDTLVLNKARMAPLARFIAVYLK
ncbi:MAG TPA: copper resistance protein NlpE N-terminal domain-containing protein [Parafilimonas sp.]|nr:copper resistance protein NlpE N-terminal domain-containing protein [Parafilimonas sp.]